MSVTDSYDGTNRSDLRYLPDDVGDDGLSDFDPGTAEDTHGPSLIEKIRANMGMSILIALLSLIVLLAVWRFLLPFLSTLNNPITYAVLVIVSYSFGLFLMGRKHYAGQLRSTDKLAVEFDKTAEIYEGQIEQEGDNLVMYPIRGWRFIGLKPVYLTVKDVDHRLTHRRGVRVEPDDRIGIRIPVELGEERMTDRWGRVVVVKGSDLDVDSFSRVPKLMITRPKQVDEDAYTDLYEAFKNIRLINKSKDEEILTLQIEKSRAHKKLRESEDSSIDRFVDRIVKMDEARSHNQPQSVMPVQMPSNPLGDDDE